MYLHSYVVSILAGCWIFSAAIACALVRGAKVAGRDRRLPGVKSRYEKCAQRGR